MPSHGLSHILPYICPLLDCVVRNADARRFELFGHRTADAWREADGSHQSQPMQDARQQVKISIAMVVRRCCPARTRCLILKGLLEWLAASAAP